MCWAWADFTAVAEYTRGIIGTHQSGWFGKSKDQRLGDVAELCVLTLMFVAGGKAMFDLIDEVTGKKYLQ